MPNTVQDDENETEAAISPDSQKQLQDASRQSKDNDTLPDISPDVKKSLEDASRQSKDNDTLPAMSPHRRKQLEDAAAHSNPDDTLITISPEMRARLLAAAKTVEIDPNKFDLEAKALAGNALLKNHTTVVFAMIDSEVLLPIHVTDRVVIGRLDVESKEKVDVDLTPYGGREAGISRRHAVLYRTRYTVSLVDLKSSNGTYLNGVRLVPHQPRLLREGDEVQIASMRFHIYFDQ